jgi:hypothetical protein
MPGGYSGPAPASGYAAGGGFLDSGTVVAPVTSTDQLQLGDGSVGTPSLGNIGDSNTGIYFPAADQVGIAVGGVLSALFRGIQIQLCGATSATIGPDIAIINRNATGADGDTAGYLTFYGPSTTGASRAYCYLEVIAVDADNTTEDSRLNVHLLQAGADITPLQIEGYQLLARGTGNPIAYSFQGDTNTGLQWVSADYAGWISNGFYGWAVDGGASKVQIALNSGATFAIFGATGSTRMAFSADATDLATTTALVNAIKAKLVSWGFMAAS